jgi:hypothetical protein
MEERRMTMTGHWGAQTEEHFSQDSRVALCGKTGAKKDWQWVTIGPTLSLVHCHGCRVEFLRAQKDIMFRALHTTDPAYVGLKQQYEKDLAEIQSLLDVEEANDEE